MCSGDTQARGSVFLVCDNIYSLFHRVDRYNIFSPWKCLLIHWLFQTKLLSGYWWSFVCRFICKVILPPADVIIFMILCTVYFHQEYLSTYGLAQMYFIIPTSLVVLPCFSLASTRQGIGISYFYRLFVYTLRKNKISPHSLCVFKAYHNIIINKSNFYFCNIFYWIESYFVIKKELEAFFY